MTNIESGGVWILTNSGKRVDLLDPKPEQIDLSDIAHHLSQLIRFSGAGDLPLTVAEHSVKVSEAVEETYPGYSTDEIYTVLWALLHDAHEAYMGDISTPMKRAIGKATNSLAVDMMADRFDDAIREALGLTKNHERMTKSAKEEIHKQDKMAGYVERSVLLPDHPDYPAHPQLKQLRRKGVHGVLTPPEAKSLFFNRFVSLRSRLLRAPETRLGQRKDAEH